MRKILFILISIFTFSLLSAQQYAYKIEIIWDEFEGEAEGVLQYYHDGKMESVRGNNYQGSKDGNIVVKSAISEAAQIFYVKKAEGCLVNIWIQNSLADADMSTDDDMLMLANSKASVTVTNMSTGEAFVAKVPSGEKGLAFHAGMIVDGVYDSKEEIFPRTGVARIKVLDALTGMPLSGVDVQLIDPRINYEFAKGLTDENGVFEHAGLEFGKFQFVLNKPQYMEARYSFPIDQTELPFSGVLAIAPKIDKLRIVLTWGKQPKDLDAHMTGPAPNGSQFHIWFRNMEMVGGKNYLDNDNTKGYGPETITVYNPVKGKYRYAVHNYSDRNKDNSNRLSFSGAVVDVYNASQWIASFVPEQGRSGNVWYVFDVDENFVLKKIDKITNTDSDKEVFQ